MFDAHTHTQFAIFEKDYREVINRSLKAGVGLINIGTQYDTSKRAIEVAHEFENEPVYASVGLHPIHTTASYHDSQELGGGDAAKAFTSRGEEFDFEKYLALARDPKVVTIGECGLDYYRIDPITKEKQIEVFRQHIEIARQTGKSLMIHCRPTKGTDNAYEDLLALCIADTSCAGIEKILHFYVGSPTMTRKFIDAGFNFEYGGVITFSRDYDASIRLIPDNRILLETDAPYVAPQSKRGQRNEPAYVIEVAAKMAEIRGVSYNRIEEMIKENAERIFKIKIT